MLDQKLLEVLGHPADGALAIVSQGVDAPHIANTWNSYVQVTADGRLLIPAGGMRETEENVKENPLLQLNIASREVQGLRYKGTGFLVQGEARFLKEGEEFATVREKYPWARSALEVTVVAIKQLL